MFHFNVLVVSWKGKIVTRKALHPRNDCRHWIVPAGSFLTNVSEIETWISVLGCKSGGRSEEWSDSIQHWQKTYSFFFSEDNQRDETFLLSYPTICCMQIQGLLCNLTPVSWNKRSVSMVSRTQRSSEKATPPSWVPLLNLLTQHRVRNGISVQYVHNKQFNSKTNASSPRGDLK